MHSRTVVRRLAALGHDTRHALFTLVLRRGRSGLCAQEAQAALGIGGSALSFHLRSLVRVGLIEGQAAAGGPVFRARPEALREVLQSFAADCCVDSRCVDGKERCGLQAQPRAPSSRLSSC